MASSHAVRQEVYQKCLINIQIKFSNRKKQHRQVLPKVGECDDQRESNLKSCKKLISTALQEDSSEWTHEDDEMLEPYSVTKEVFWKTLQPIRTVQIKSTHSMKRFSQYIKIRVAINLTHAVILRKKYGEQKEQMTDKLKKFFDKNGWEE